LRFASQHWSGESGAQTFQRADPFRVVVGGATVAGGGVGTFALRLDDDFRRCAAMECPLFSPPCSVLRLPSDRHFDVHFRADVIGLRLRNAQRLFDAAVVSSVAPASAAAGRVEPGDVVVRVSGRSVRQSSFADVQRHLSVAQRPLTLTFMRLRVAPPAQSSAAAPSDAAAPANARGAADARVDAFECIDAELWGFHAPSLEFDGCDEL
jgi:hypothetical protein